MKKMWLVFYSSTSDFTVKVKRKSDLLHYYNGKRFCVEKSFYESLTLH